MCCSVILMVPFIAYKFEVIWLYVVLNLSLKIIYFLRDVCCICITDVEH